MDILVLRVDVPKEGFAGKLGADETVFAAYHGAVGEVQQFVEILLRHERDFDETDRGRLKNIAVVLQSSRLKAAGLESDTITNVVRSGREPRARQA